MKTLASRAVVSSLLTAMSVLRRLDHHINGSAALRHDAEFRVDPYPSYEFMRPRGGIHRSFTNQGWIAIGHAEIQEILRHPNFSNELSQNKLFFRILDAATGDAGVPFADNPPLLNLDPPDHTRIRKLISPGFTNRFLQSFAPAISTFVDDLLSRIDTSIEADMIAQLATPLPAWVITEMMGVPESERARFIDWSHDLIGATVVSRPDLIVRASRAEAEMSAYFADLIERKRERPGDDFVSRLMDTDAGNLSSDELIATCILLLSAGHETTTRLIGNGLFTLLKHPEQMAKLRENRELLPMAIEEMLRFEPPVQMTLRFVKDDMDFHGHRFRAGHMIMLNFGAASRDPGANALPNQFDITRQTVNHVAFGHGIHHCLGVTLARLEAQIAFNALLDRYSVIEYAGPTPATWQANPFFRGLETLPVRLTR